MRRIYLLARLLAKDPASRPSEPRTVAEAILPLTAIRHLPLFAIASVILTGEFIAEVWNRRAGDLPAIPSSLAPWFAGLSIAARCKALGMDVVAYDPFVSPQLAQTTGVANLVQQSVNVQANLNVGR